MIDAAEQIYLFADFEVDAGKRRLLKNAQAVALNPKAFDLLLVLIENRGQIVLKEELLEKVWANQFVEENNLTVHISALRKIFGEKRGEHQFIATIPGKGYKFVAELNEASAENAIVIENHSFSRIVVDEEIEQTPPENATIKQLPPKRNNRVFAFLIIGFLIAATIGVWIFVNRSTANAAPIESIAVMPFVNESGNAETEYLSDGMTESLINNLSQLPNLTVKARNSVFQYKGKIIEAQKIGDELTVQAVLLGRIVERGDQLVLSLELIDAKTNNHLWGEQYTRQMSDLPTLQTEIARDVSGKLRRKLANNETPPQKQIASSEAYQLYLKGRYLWNKRNPKDLAKAAELFEQAIALESDYALAYAGVGDVYTVDFFHVGDKAAKTAKGRAAALKALEIDPNLAEAYAVLGKCEWSIYNWTEAEKNFKRALEINPNYASVHQWYAEFLMRQAKIEASIGAINRALELDPLSLIINSDAIYLETMARQYDRAIAQADKTLELDANWRLAYLWRAIANEYKGNFAAALTDFERENETTENSQEKKQQKRTEIREIREAFEQSGAPGYWRKWLEIEKRRPGTEADYAFVAVLYANLGEKENALDALEQAFVEKDSDIDLMKVEAHFDSLRAEPRFQTLLRRINLEP